MPLRRMLVLLLPLLWGPLSSGAESPDAAKWQSVRHGSGPGYEYQLFSRNGEGEKFVRYQVRGTVRASPERLMHAAFVASVDPELAPKNQTRRLLANDAREGFVVHTTIDLPTFFSDRDVVTRGFRKVDPASGVVRIDWEAIDHELAPRDGDKIRIEVSGGSWIFEPDSDPEKTQVTHDNYVDLGGSLPTWLIDSMMPGAIAETFEDLAREALAPERTELPAPASG